MNSLLRRVLLTVFPSKNVFRVDWQADKHDTATVMLFAAFDLLEAYVEVEKAYLWAIEHESDQAPKWYNTLWWRNPTFGVQRLEQDMLITLPSGAQSKTSKTATEIKALYDWWEKRRATKHGWEQVTDLLKLSDEAETDSTKEDQAMLARLVKIRLALVS